MRWWYSHLTSQRGIHPAAAPIPATSSPMQVPGESPHRNAGPLTVYIHSTEIAKAGEKEVELQAPILQKGDGVPEVIKTPSSGVHCSQCTDPLFLTLRSTGSFIISTLVLGHLSQCGLSVLAGRRNFWFLLSFYTSPPTPPFPHTPFHPHPPHLLQLNSCSSAVTSSCITLSYGNSSAIWHLGESKQLALVSAW